MTPPELPAFGHGTAGRGALNALLHDAGIAAGVDVRTAPGSRRAPDLARWRPAARLPGEDIAYRWERDLGGFGEPPPDSPDVIRRNASFRGRAAYTRTPEFVAVTDVLLDRAAREATAVMCGEAVWRRCHRRLIADFAVLARGVPVRHLMHDGRHTRHSPTPGARLRDDGLIVHDDTTAAS